MTSEIWATVWLHDDEINVGDSIVEAINSGLGSADYVILCYSSSGVNSPWTSREWMSGLARQLNGSGVRLIPVHLTGTDSPPILADIKHADLASDWVSGLANLARALQ
jgi:hypothetical protein